jgi:hypothetical protein
VIVHPPALEHDLAATLISMPIGMRERRAGNNGIFREVALVGSGALTPGWDNPKPQLGFTIY